jgi:hypothetical protein
VTDRKTSAELIDFAEHRRLFGFAKRVSAARMRYEQETARSDNVEGLQRAFGSYIGTLMVIRAEIEASEAEHDAA